MVTDKLHKILDDENMKISPERLCQMIQDLKQSAWDEYYKELVKIHSSNYNLSFFDGEINAFNIVLYLLGYLDVSPIKNLNIKEEKKEG